MVFACALQGLAVISLLVLAINIKLNMKSNDQKAFVVLTKFDLSKKIQKTAALIICKFFRLIMLQKKGEVAQNSHLIIQLKDLAEQLQKDIRLHKSRKNPNVSEDMLRSFEDFKASQQSAKFSVALAGRMVSMDLERISKDLPSLEILGEILTLPLESDEFKIFKKDLFRRKTSVEEEDTQETDTLRRDKTKNFLKGIDAFKTVPLQAFNIESSFSDPEIHTVRNTVTLKQKF